MAEENPEVESLENKDLSQKNVMNDTRIQNPRTIVEYSTQLLLRKYDYIYWVVVS